MSLLFQDGELACVPGVEDDLAKVGGEAQGVDLNTQGGYRNSKKAKASSELAMDPLSLFCRTRWLRVALKIGKGPKKRELLSISSASH